MFRHECEARSPRRPSFAARAPASCGATGEPESAARAWLQKSGPWTFFDDDDLGSALRRADGGSPLSGLLLLGVLVLVLLETMLARWFSHAYRTGPTAESILAPTVTERIGRAKTGGDA